MFSHQGGEFYYLEHVAADDQSWLSTFQWLINPVQKAIGDNCHVTRRTWEEIDQAGFTRVSQERFTAPIRAIHIAPHLVGVATK